MNSIFRRAVFVAGAVAAIATQTVFAQSKITVSKDAGDAAMFTTVQAAVNAARPGDVVEILDAAVYEEQVTIDGRDASPWTGVVGGKSGITLRSKNPTGSNKPVIKYRDTKNTSPKNSTEANVNGELPGSSGNFQTCGALRVMHAKNVTIDGIIIDGGSPFVFGAPNVFGTSALFHGNAAVSLFVAGGAQIRNCELRNAYFGIYVKDRNVGGVFGNTNPDDHDVTVPLSGFGKAGNHLLEYNRVHDNAVGFFFESSWDLGSTVRYNLIYNNYYTATTKSAYTALSLTSESIEPGAFVFKDNYLSPIAIYNNTFHNNYANFIGHWQIGGQHLIFNNIFGSSSGASTGNGHSFMVIDHKFPNRMKHCVFPVSDRSSSGSMAIQTQTGMCADNPNNPYIPGNSFILDVRITSDFAPVTKTTVTLNMCSGTTQAGMTQVPMVLPGAIISGTSGSTSTGTLPTTANIRWLEMLGGTFKSGTSASSSSITLPSLFQSTDPASSNFLEPKWDDQLVMNYIKNKGWPDAGIRNPDGTTADLGAIPSSSAKRQAVTARIRPTDLVRVTGTNAAISFYLSAEGGELRNPKIKYVKWIYQIPTDNATSPSSFGGNFTVIPTDNVRTITLPTNAIVTLGNNVLQDITVPAVSANTYGFFELTVEGTDQNGNAVTSDVGFLPFRPLDYSLKMEILKDDGTAVNSAAVGELVKLRVTPMKGTAAYTGAISEVEFWLNSGAAQMWIDDVTPFTGDKNLTGSKTYSVFFKTGGNEVIYAAGTSTSGASALPFFGSREITVSDRYTLRYRADAGGSIAIGDTLQVVERGGRGTTVVALPDDNSGYEFTMWSDGVTNFMRTDSNVTASKTVTAYFCGGDNIKLLSYKAGAGGSIGGPANQKVCGGSSGFPVSAVPNEGYKFVDWSDGKKVAGRTDAGVTENMEFTAKFAVKTYTLVYAAGQNGTLIGGDTVMTVTHGSSGGLVLARADDGYEFVTWSDGVKDNPRIDNNVSANIAAMAVFDTLKHTVSYYVNPQYGLLAGSSMQRVSHGANASAVYITGTNGYTFFEWSDGSKDTIRIDKNVKANIAVAAHFKDSKGKISVASYDREIPKINSESQSTLAPVAITTSGEFTAGPNPIGKHAAEVNFFWQGKGIKNSTLYVYDASGNSVRKINLSDKTAGNVNGKRTVGSWDLKDKKGRLVSEGTYLVKGTIKTAGGKKENVSLVVGVR